VPTNQLYHTWIQRILELRPGQRITQVRNFVWLIIGIYQSRSVSLSRIASKIPGSAQLLSYTRRLSRLLENPAMDVRSWYEPIARSWLALACCPSSTSDTDCRWYKSGFYTSIVDDLFGLSETSHPDCLDMGKASAGSQYLSYSIGFVGLCAYPFATRNCGSVGRRHRIWISEGIATIGQVALELRFASKNVYPCLFGAAV